MYNPGIIVQARLTSSRFPNKVLCPLLGKPVIDWVLDEIIKTELPWVVALPKNKTDLGIREYLKLWSDKNGVRVRTGVGHKEDLIYRFTDVNRVTEFDPIIRICADSPFLSHQDIEIALKIFNERKYFTMLNHVQVFSKEELEYQNLNDPHIESRQHAGARGMLHTVDYPEDIDKYELEFSKNSPTMKGRMELRKNA